MPSTLRTELDRLGYDWADGEMIMQVGSGYQTPTKAVAVEAVSPLLNQRFSNGSGFSDMPRFLASDASGVYIPYRDQHGMGLQKIFHKSAEYLKTGQSIPYPDH